MSYLLDTNIVSQLAKSKPDVAAMDWLSRIDHRQCFLSVITLLEISSGIVTMPEGQKQTHLSKWLDETVPTQFEGRILAVGAEIALNAGRLMGGQKQTGFNAEVEDALIAATARVHGLSLVTLNRKHFERLDVPLVRF